MTRHIVVWCGGSRNPPLSDVGYHWRKEADRSSRLRNADPKTASFEARNEAEVGVKQGLRMSVAESFPRGVVRVAEFCCDRTGQLVGFLPCPLTPSGGFTAWNK